MAERMADERLAEIERYVRVKGGNGNSSYAVWRQREELLQALKAERQEVERLRDEKFPQYSICPEHPYLTGTSPTASALGCPYCKLERLVEGLKRALHDRCIGIRHHHDQPAAPIGQRQFEARIHALVADALLLAERQDVAAADHIRDLEAQLARLVEGLEGLVNYAAATGVEDE